MRKLLLFAVLLQSMFVFGQTTTTINFDTLTNWVAGSGSLTSYQSDHSYSDGVFSSTNTNGLQNSNSMTDGVAGANGTYSWRLRNTATDVWTANIASGGVSTFDVMVRRWDGSPEPVATLDYSLDAGLTWVHVDTINNTSLNNASSFVNFSGTINSTVANIQIRIQNVTGERLMIDDFVWTDFCPSTSNSISITGCDSIVVNAISYTSTGAYTQTLTNAAGCDSILTINATVNNSETTAITVSACDAYMVPSGDEIYTASGVYSDTIPTSAGCDSIINITLTIGTSSSSTITPTVCDTYTVPSGDETYTADGMYMDTVMNAAGCDSVITINLTVNNSSTNSMDITGCDSVVVNATSYVTSGTYTQTLTNAAGCDSVLTINATVNNSDANSFSVVECNSYTAPSGFVITTSGVYMDTIPTSAGCDSIQTITVLIGTTVTTNTINPIVCDTYTVPSGDETYTASGMYMDTLVNSVGCDSVLTINLTVNLSTTNSIDITGCDSIVVNTTSYMTSGTYTQTLTNATGCDSVLTINATVNNSDASSLTIVECNSYTAPSGLVITTSGVYMDTIPTSTGCDSIITITATIGTAATTNTINPIVCDTYTVPSGDETYTVSGMYMDTLINSVGCDSVLTINLTVNNSNTGTLTLTACNILTVNAVDYTSSGTYTQTLTNAAGCDSVLTINATVIFSTTGTTSVTGCDSVVVNSISYYTSGTYMDTLTNAAGCDSVLTITATVNSSSSITLALNGCDSATFNGTSYFTTGTYFDTLTNSTGCDYIVTLNATITYSTGSSVDLSGCDNFATLNGYNYWTSGVYTQTYTNSVGCDSIVTVNVTISPSMSASTTTTGEFVGADGTIDLTVTGGIAPYTFLWSNAATSEDLSGLVGGTYDVTITDDNGCSITQTGTVQSFVGINELENSTLVVYPNPSTTGLFSWEMENSSEMNITISDVTGRVVSTYSANVNNGKIDLSGYADGTYYVVFASDQTTSKARLIKQ